MKHINGFLATPPLWTQTAFGLSQFEMPSINLSTFIAQPIPSKLRLGHQIEFIFKQLLDHTERYTVLAHNIQILRGKNTIGELDFIVEDRFRESKKIHIELTYKFYILDDTIKEPIHRLIGPNRKDSFFTKMEKTRDKQLPLIFTPEGRSTLSTININPDELEQQTYFLAQLFKPYGKLSTIIEPLNEQCIVGYWIRMEDFNNCDFKRYSFYIALKNEWLHEPHLDRDYIDHKNVLKLIVDKHIDKRAPLLWVKKENNMLEKCFVVWW
ncbi:hypothetical protein DCS32_14955 [Dokdonia sp. Dokd-P16]|uniref:DUF1853 family protein n=1 Tax=Dokdonia sp. Dokd-P16 TaxID=2173169 RepID=UPI000D54415D|nr:DUF1853 family protein [Dokdonia sp. Dokd-P16]AWH75414.1 hypothetical protein DCS32_14955 [Dokdonia sp. Dokd-P16]